jgi:transketolase
VAYVFTHDSVGVGEDGPTHQPVEHLASLRAMPNLWVLRPADGNETAAAWRVALERREGPTVLALSRQKLPPLPAEAKAAEGALRGGYVVAREAGAGDADLVLIGTGSEVAVALGARELLAREGVRARVVSLPCFELFEAQEASYRAEVLPAGVPRLAVEAGSPFGWERWVGEREAVIGIDRFGASAPGGVIFEKLGITAEAVAQRARDWLGS